jgi:hypothetical protein
MKEKQLRSKNFRSSTPASSPTEQRLNLKDEIPMREEDCNNLGLRASKNVSFLKFFL